MPYLCAFNRIMLRLYITLLLAMLGIQSVAQEGLGYYYDYYNHFYVFDHGKNIQLESNPVDSIRAGNDYLAYISQGGDLKVYYNGEVITIEENIPNEMIASANALVYKMQKRLMIFERGEKQELSPWAQNYSVSDNMVTWQEVTNLNIMTYQNGEIKTIESGFSVKAINANKTSKNVFAYSDMNNEFKVFFNNEVFDSQLNNIRNFKCGLNTVAFLDRFNNAFIVFYDGAYYTLSDRLPKSYTVADNAVFYTDANDNLMLYYAGKLVQLETFLPSFQRTKDNIIAYYNDPELKVVYAGQKITLDKFSGQPNLILGPNSALYLDNNNRPKYFYKGKLYENFLNEPVRELYLYRDLPFFKYGNNTVGFYYEGKMYEFEGSRDR